METTTRNIKDAKKMKIDDALRILEEAARDTSSDLKSVLEEKYHNAQSAIENVLGFSAEEAFKKASKNVRDLADRSNVAIRETAYQVDTTVHQNPWAFIAGGTI